MTQNTEPTALDELRRIVVAVKTDLRLRKNPETGAYLTHPYDDLATLQDASGRYILLDAYAALVIGEAAEKIAGVVR